MRCEKMVGWQVGVGDPVSGPNSVFFGLNAGIFRLCVVELNLVAAGNVASCSTPGMCRRATIQPRNEPFRLIRNLMQESDQFCPRNRVIAASRCCRCVIIPYLSLYLYAVMRIKVEAATMQDLLIDNLLARDLHGL